MNQQAAEMADHLRLLDRLVGASVALLVAAIAIYAAVKLIVAVWSTLLIILGGALIIAGLVSVWRSRVGRGWQ